MMTLEQPMTMTVTAKPHALASGPATGSEHAALLEIIQETGAQVNWPGKGGLFRGSSGGTFPVELLMRELICAVVAGVDSTGSVNPAGLEDLRQLCAGCLVERQTLREFRRSYRRSFQQCLTRLLEKMVLIRFGTEMEEASIADSCVTQAWDRWFESLRMPLAWREAEEAAPAPAESEWTLFA